MTGMDPAASDGLGHVVSDLGLYSVQAGGAAGNLLWTEAWKVE